MSIVSEAVVPGGPSAEHITRCSAEFVAAARELGIPIPVTDAIPPDRLRVLVFCEGRRWEIGLHHDADGSWTDEGWFLIPDVSHWLPLPAHPSSPNARTA